MSRPCRIETVGWCRDGTAFISNLRWQGVALPSAKTMEGMPMTSQKKRQIIAGALMTTAMAGALSGFFTLLEVGITREWPGLWLSSFLMGWPVGFVVSAIVAGPVQRLATRLSGYDGRSHA